MPRKIPNRIPNQVSSTPSPARFNPGDISEARINQITTEAAKGSAHARISVSPSTFKKLDSHSVMAGALVTAIKTAITHPASPKNSRVMPRNIENIADMLMTIRTI